MSAAAAATAHTTKRRERERESFKETCFVLLALSLFLSRALLLHFLLSGDLHVIEHIITGLSGFDDGNDECIDDDDDDCMRHVYYY